MTKPYAERWEVRRGSHASIVPGAKSAKDAHGYRRLLSLPERWKVWRVQTWHTETVYAWRTRAEQGHFGVGWWDAAPTPVPGWVGRKKGRTLFADPIGLGSRCRAKAAALAAKPMRTPTSAADAVLVRIRRRIP